jgi:hypothetical protein
MRGGGGNFKSVGAGIRIIYSPSFYKIKMEEIISYSENFVK